VQEVTEITTNSRVHEPCTDSRALAALRQVESRDDKRPQLSDLRESGRIEQTPTWYCRVSRGILLAIMSCAGQRRHLKWQTEMDLYRRPTIIGKQRHGPTGSVQVHLKPMSPGSAICSINTCLSAQEINSNKIEAPRSRARATRRAR
jgi:replicative DNA helicase